MCIHTRHCCVEHGCKYGEEDGCPVYQGIVKQEQACEHCRDGVFPVVDPKVMKERHSRLEELHQREVYNE